MAYMREGYIKIKANGRELIIDELDEDAVDIEAAEDKTNRRMTTRGKNIYSMIGNVPYELTIAIKPDTKTMGRVLDFIKFLKSNKYPDFEFETNETIDTKSVITYYTDGNLLTELDSDGAFKTDAPVTTLKIVGTRINKEIA
jgi:hypothetical protein